MNFIISCFVSLSVLLLWWPVSMRQMQTKETVEKSYHQLLLALISEIETAPNFDEAFESVVQMTFSQWSTANPEQAIMLSRVRQLALESGISSKSLISLLLTQLQHTKASANTWKEKSAAARTASMMLFVLPLGLWLMASAMGVDAQGWLFGTSWGKLCLVVGLTLNGISRWLLRKLNRKFTSETTASQVKSSTAAIPKLDPNLVAILTAMFLVISFPNIFGLTLAVVSFIAVREGWSSLQSSHHLASHKLMHQQRPWAAAVIAASLHSGASWLDGVQNAVAHCDAIMRTELSQVTLRLRWGVDPEIAFNAAHVLLRPMSETIQRSARTGAPIHSTLMAQATLWQEESHTQRIQITEVAAERLIVPVTLLQLPAFFLLGVVPMVVAEIAPMLETFSTTAIHLS